MKRKNSNEQVRGILVLTGVFALSAVVGFQMTFARNAVAFSFAKTISVCTPYLDTSGQLAPGSFNQNHVWNCPVDVGSHQSAALLTAAYVDFITGNIPNGGGSAPVPANRVHAWLRKVSSTGSVSTDYAYKDMGRYTWGEIFVRPANITKNVGTWDYVSLVLRTEFLQEKGNFEFLGGAVAYK